MIEITEDDFAEYVELRYARRIIVEKLRRSKSIQVLDLLDILGGAEAWQLYDEITKEDKDVQKRD